MRLTLRTFLALFVLLPGLLAGCDATGDRGSGSFQVEVWGDRTTRLEGSAQLFTQTAPDGDEPVSFEIILTAQRSEIAIRSVDGSGAPQQTTYEVEQTATGASSQVVRVTFDPDRLSATSELFEAYSGVLTITKVTDAVVEGEFDLDATGTNDASLEVSLVGQFMVQK